MSSTASEPTPPPATGILAVRRKACGLEQLRQLRRRGHPILIHDRNLALIQIDSYLLHSRLPLQGAIDPGGSAGAEHTRQLK